MQTQKADIRSRIMSVSRELFTQKGFRGTTTRDIAAAAGIGLSNLYHYFSSKDELFVYLLKPTTDEMERLLDEHHGIKGNDIERMQDVNYTEESLKEYMGLIGKHRDALKMLLFHSEGSSLENYKEYYVNKATKQVITWFQAMKEKYPEINIEVSDFFIHLNNVWMFTLIEEILMHDLPEEETRTVLTDYIRFEVIGWKKMMKI